MPAKVPNSRPHVGQGVRPAARGRSAPVGWLVPDGPVARGRRLSTLFRTVLEPSVFKAHGGRQPPWACIAGAPLAGPSGPAVRPGPSGRCPVLTDRGGGVGTWPGFPKDQGL